MNKQSIIDLRKPTWGNAYHSHGLLHSCIDIKENDYVVLKQEYGDTVFKILEVKCMNDPKDMYQIKKYINVGTLEDERKELNLQFLNNVDIKNKQVFTF